MILTVGDLLDGIIEEEKSKIREYEIIKHGPMIGDMYEGLTKEVLSRAIFPSIGLRISRGKIKSESGEMSRQIDCMIVVGDGDKIPHTQNYIYDINDVVAVIEVKKSLYYKDLHDAMSLFSQLSRGPGKQIKPHDGSYSILADAWRSITALPVPAENEISKLPRNLGYIFHSLRCDASLPVKIVLGYEGYSSEHSFRQGIVKYFTDSSGSLGSGPLSIPSLILCRNNAVIKLNGMPYAVPLQPDNWWVLLGSRSGSPAVHLLELIWSRISYRFRVGSDIFGDDLTMDGVNGLIKAKISDNEEGWYFKSYDLSEEALAKAAEAGPMDWSPAELTLAEYVVMSELCSKEFMTIDDSLTAYLAESGVSIEALCESLSQKRLASRSISGSQITLLTKECGCVAVNGKFYAAENASGRLEKWVIRQTKKSNDQVNPGAKDEKPKTATDS